MLDKGQWWDALKSGSLVLIALIALWTAGLLTIELQRKTVRQSARKLITTFMAFCVLLLLFGAGFEFFDQKWKAVENKAENLDKFRFESFC
jgi:hypothetical protein